jgi:hypothetical protein
MDHEAAEMQDQASAMPQPGRATPQKGRATPQEGRERLILTPPVGWLGTDNEPDEMALIRRLNPKTVMMMGDNPALPPMPDKPTLRDFFELRFGAVTQRHLTVSAKRALDEGQSETVVMACLLHDISNGALIRCDHGYWSAQLVAPYVSEEVAWAIQHHQGLRYFADPEVGYEYPASYHMFFGPDFVPPAYLRRDAEAAKAHKWYKTARAVTLYDTYFFDDSPAVEWGDLAGVVERQFRHPAEGLGFDGSPTAHMWRTMIWPNNFL